MESYSLLGHLRLKHPLPRWAFFDEMRDGTGYSQSRTIDAMAFDTWPSGHGRRIAYEIKVSRRDFQKEIDDPDKRRWVEQCCHQTWFVMPKGLVEPSEIPESWGLMEGTSKVLRVRKIAPVRDAVSDPSYAVVLSMLRRAADQSSQAQRRTFSLEGEILTIEQINALVTSKIEAEREKLHEDRMRVSKAEVALRDERRLLVGPLEHLWNRAGTRYMGESSVPNLEAIDAMIERVVGRRLVAMSSTLREAHRATGIVLDHLDAQKPEGTGLWPAR